MNECLTLLDKLAIIGFGLFSFLFGYYGCKRNKKEDLK